MRHNVFISSVKIFLDYDSVNLLDRRVNSLDMTTSEDKLKAISFLSYLFTLSNLKHYLDLTDYLRSSVHMYAQLILSLQELKTRLLKDASRTENARKSYSSMYRLSSSSNLKKISFDNFQETLSNLSILAHHNLNRDLWIDLNVSHEFDFEVQMFHVKSNHKSLSEKWSSRSFIELIMFLSRVLISAKRNYWSTELEIIDFV